MSDITSAENGVLENGRKQTFGKQQTVYQFNRKWPKMGLWKMADNLWKMADKHEETWKVADSHQGIVSQMGKGGDSPILI